MLIVSYDISDNKLRTKFSKYLSKFGGRLQYSVFEIKNSERIIQNIISNINKNFEKSFSQKDSVLIFNMSKQCEIVRFGFAKNDENDLIVL